MKTLVVTLLFAAAAFSQDQQQTTPGDQQPQQTRKRDRNAGEARRASMKKLQADLDQAASRAKLSDEQRKQFDDARAVLRQQAQRGRRNGGATTDSASTGNAREAMKTLRGLVSSEAFQAEDRELLRKDFDEIRKSGGQRNRQSGKARKSGAA